MPEYVCQNCTTEVTGSPFLSSCPDCGAPLEKRSRRKPGGIER